MTRFASFALASAVALLAASLAKPAAAAALYGAYVSGSIENTGCAVGANGGNCLFAGTNPGTSADPNPSPPGVTSASGSLGDGFAAISGFATLATGDISVSVNVTGAPNSGAPGAGNPAAVQAVIFDTVTFHFSGPSAVVTIRSTGTASMSGDAGLFYEIGLQSGGPIVPYFFPATPVPLVNGTFDISKQFTVQPDVAYELDIGFRATASGNFLVGFASLDDPLTIELAEGATFDSASGILLRGDTESVPEPSAATLSGAALALLTMLLRRRRPARPGQLA